MLIEIQLKAQEKCQIVFHIHVDGIVQGNDLEQGGIPVVRISYCIVEGEQSFPLIEKHAKQGIFVIAPGPDGSETAPSCLLLFHFRWAWVQYGSLLRHTDSYAAGRKQRSAA